MTVHGQDWASYQSATPNTSGLDFAFIKATEGTGYVNPRMASQAATARAAGLVVGFYHFVRPGDMAAQAAYFVDKAVSAEGDPLFVDWEDAGVTSAQKDAFIAEVKRLRGSNHRVGLYCNRDFWLNHDVSSNAGDALWIADYVTAGSPRIEAKWLFHQYTSTPIDTNLGAFADKAALTTWAKMGSVTPTAPTKAPTKAPTVSAATYTVKSGDTLSGIASAHGVSLSSLLAANPSYKAHPNLVHVGDKVKLPGKSTAAKPKTYTVKSGDTLSGIAVKYKTTVSALAKANGIKDVSKIYPGDVLKV